MIKQSIIAFLVFIFIINSVYAQSKEINFYTLTENDVTVEQNKDGGLTITGCNNTHTDIIIPAKLHGLPVTHIGNRAFRDKNITNITFPNTLIEIGNNAFAENKLTAISLPNNLKTIESEAFIRNNIATVRLPDGIEYVSTMAFDNNPITEIYIPVSLGINGLFGTSGRSFPSTITRYILPAGIHDYNLIFVPAPLKNFYIAQGRKAGTYIFNGFIWVRE